MAPVPVAKLIIGSGLVFTFLKARSHSAGYHQAEDDLNELVTKLKEQAKAKGVKASLPRGGACDVEGKFGGVDGTMWQVTEGRGETKLKAAMAGYMTIIGNGPIGVYDVPRLNTDTKLEEQAKAKGVETIPRGKLDPES